MLKLTIISPHKTKESWLNEAIQDYEKRLSHSIKVFWKYARDDTQLEKLLPKNYICLDPKGSQMTSEHFSKFLENAWVKEGSSLCFLIGGAEGIPLHLKKDKQMISLSLMTFTHQMVRLIFIEQIYRALEISKGSQYHKAS